MPTLGTAHATLTSATPTPTPTATPAASSSATATSSAAAGRAARGCAGLDGTLQSPERRAQRCLNLRRMPPLGGHLR